MSILSVLIIDDDKVWQDLIKVVIETFPCNIQTVSNYVEAQAVLKEHAFDIITLDMQLSSMDDMPRGWLLLRMLKRDQFPLSRNVRVVVLSGSSEFETSPDKVDELRTEFPFISRFLWKYNDDWDDKLDETIDRIMNQVRTSTEKNMMPAIDMARFRLALTESFSEAELKNLSFDLGVDYETLTGIGKVDRARELLVHFERRGELSKLFYKVKELRPNVHL